MKKCLSIDYGAVSSRETSLSSEKCVDGIEIFIHLFVALAFVARVPTSFAVLAASGIAGDAAAECVTAQGCGDGSNNGSSVEAKGFKFLQLWSKDAGQLSGVESVCCTSGVVGSTRTKASSSVASSTAASSATSATSSAAPSSSMGLHSNQNHHKNQ